MLFSAKSEKILIYYGNSVILWVKEGNDMSLREEIGQRIKERRESLGISQVELAEILGYSHRSMVSLIESGKRALDVDQLIPLVDALHCSFDDILKGPALDDEITETLESLTPDQKEAALKHLLSMTGDK